MKYFQELKYEEISEILRDFPLGVKSFLSLGLKKNEAFLKKIKPS